MKLTKTPYKSKEIGTNKGIKSQAQKTLRK